MPECLTPHIKPRQKIEKMKLLSVLLFVSLGVCFVSGNCGCLNVSTNRAPCVVPMRIVVFLVQPKSEGGVRIRFSVQGHLPELQPSSLPKGKYLFTPMHHLRNDSNLLLQNIGYSVQVPVPSGSDPDSSGAPQRCYGYQVPPSPPSPWSQPNPKPVSGSARPGRPFGLPAALSSDQLPQLPSPDSGGGEQAVQLHGRAGWQA